MWIILIKYKNLIRVFTRCCPEYEKVLCYIHHGRPDIASHTNPHYHPNPVNNPSQHGGGIPGLHPQTPR